MRLMCTKTLDRPWPWSMTTVPPVRYRSLPTKLTMPPAGAWIGVPVPTAMSTP
jgi:hypothetical protein